MAPPQRQPSTPARASPRAPTHVDTNDNDTSITWNTVTSKVPAFLMALEKDDYFYSNTRGSLSLFTRGYEIDSKGKKVVESEKHTLDIIDNPDKEYTFANPSPVGAHTVADATEAAAIRRRLGTDPPPLPSSASAEDVAEAKAKATQRHKELRDQFTVNPQRLAEIDREAAAFIQSAITNSAFAKKLVTDHKFSARNIVKYLFALKANKISDKAKRALAKDLDDRVKEGLSHPTVEAFNLFSNEITELNDQLKIPKGSLELAEIYLEASRDALGEVRQVKLDIKIEALDQSTFSPEAWLNTVVEKITEQITDLEDDMAKDGKQGNRALRATDDPYKGSDGKKKKKKEKKNDSSTSGDRGERPAWESSKGECKYKAFGGCDGKHWNSTCPQLKKNGGTLEEHVKPPAPEGAAKMGRAKQDSSSSKQESEKQDELMKAFLAGGSQLLDLTKITKPEDLLGALTCKDEGAAETSTSATGRALMGRGGAVPPANADDDDVNSAFSEEEDDEDEDEDDGGPAAASEQQQADDDSDSSSSSDAEQEAAATQAAAGDVPMGTPVPSGPRVPTLDELTPTTPLRDLQLFIESSASPAVRAVSRGTGGVSRRTKVDILHDIQAASASTPAAGAGPTATAPAAPPSAKWTPDCGSCRHPGGHWNSSCPHAAPATEPRSHAEAEAMTQPMLRLACKLPPDVQFADMVSPPLVPPLLQNSEWNERDAFRNALAQLYRLAWAEGGFSEPPNMSASAKGLNKKANAFLYRRNADLEMIGFPQALEFGCPLAVSSEELGKWDLPESLVDARLGGPGAPRSYRAKCAIYLRTYLIGTEDFAQARSISPPGGSPRLLESLKLVQRHASNLLSSLTYHGSCEDAAIWTLAGVLEHDFSKAWHAANASRLVVAYIPLVGDVPLSPGLADAVERTTGFAQSCACSVITLLIGMLIATSLAAPPAPNATLLLGGNDLLDEGARPAGARPQHHAGHLASTAAAVAMGLLCVDPSFLTRRMLPSVFHQANEPLGGGASPPCPTIPIVAVLLIHYLVSSIATAFSFLATIASLGAALALAVAQPIAHDLSVAAAVGFTAAFAACSGDAHAAAATVRCVMLAPSARRAARALQRVTAVSLAAVVAMHVLALALTSGHAFRADGAFGAIASAVGAFGMVATRLGGGRCFLDSTRPPSRRPPRRQREVHTKRKLARRSSTGGPTGTLARRVRRQDSTRSRPGAQPCSGTQPCPDVPVSTGKAYLSKRKQTPAVIHSKVNVLAQTTGKANKAGLASVILSLVMDSGCTYHCHPRQSDLINFRPRRERMVGIDGNSCNVVGIGDLPIIANDSAGERHKLLIQGVRCVPQFTDTLLSVDQFWQDSNVEVRFAGYNHVRLPKSDEGPRLHFPFERDEGLFQWRAMAINRLSPSAKPFAPRCLGATPDDSTAEQPMALDDPSEHVSKDEQLHGAKSISHLAALSADAAMAAIHRRLHVSQETIRHLPDLTSDAPEHVRKGRVHSCAACVEANAPRLPHKGTRYTPSSVGRLVHADIVGPFKKSLIGRYQYLLVLVDDHSRYISVHPLQQKSDALSAVKTFVADITAQMNVGRAEPVQIVGSLHTDNAGEFLSQEFSEFLDDQLISHTTCPPHVHSLNGVAERAIRAVVENMRSNLVAGNVPITFWPFVAQHSADVLNRTGGPPESTVTSYEMVTGKKPKVLGIWPIGCRAFPVKPRSAYSKTLIEPHAWKGINLGRVPTVPDAHYIWLSQLHRVAISSDVWFDETLMPWRPTGEQRVGAPPPHASPSDDQPPGLVHGALPDTPEAAKTLGEAFDRAVVSPDARARRSSRVLLLFSGPKARPDGLAAFLNRLGYDCELVDNDPITGGGKREDILDGEIFDSLLSRVQSGEFLAIIAAPPCSTFSIARFISSVHGDGGPKPVRSRRHIEGLKNLTPSGRKQLLEANLLVKRTCALLIAGHLVGTQYIIENPSDRGDPREADIFLHEDHGPLWHMPAMLALERVAGGRRATFPMCAFDSPWQKFTTLAYSPGFESWIAPLSHLRCHHATHSAMAGGEHDGERWNSAKAAAYPPDFNLYLARCVAALSGEPLAPPEDARPAAKGLEKGRGVTNPAAEEGAPPATQPRATARIGADAPPDDDSPPKRLDFDVASDDSPTPERLPERRHNPLVGAAPVAGPKRAPRPQPPITSGARNTRSQNPTLVADGGQRNASSQGLSIGMALLCLGGPWRLGSPALKTGAAGSVPPADPRSHAEAMAMDREGWLASEKAELDNHAANGSWELIDYSEFAKTKRRLVKTVWVYKVKRNGKLKSRLCVQGCSQMPGVDYDQTHCATMRAPTLRMLASIASKLGLRMRRWDFVAAYLQGELLEGEVVYCKAPAGHATKGADGLDQVLKVVKPIYGMAQAGRRWQRTLYPWMEEWCSKGAKFTRLFADSNVFVCRQDVDTPSGKRPETLIVGVYVDDQFVLYSHDDQYSLYQRYVTDLQKRWSVDDEGEVSDLLGVEISSQDGFVELKQEQYIDRLATKWFPEGVPEDIQGNRPPADKDLAQHVADALVDLDSRDPGVVKNYQSLVGALLYASTNTRPDIAYSVGMLCRVMAKPTPELQEAALRVLGYLYRTKHIGLRYRADAKPMYGMSDSDWGVKHSTSGYVFMYNSAAITWGSKKQSSVALSSCEAEIMAASLAATEAVHLTGFLEELGMSDPNPIKVSVDNTAARDIAYNPEHHQKVKHIARRHFYIRECVEENRLTVPYVNTVDNIADFFTKALDAKDYFRFRDIIMNVPPAKPAWLARAVRRALQLYGDVSCGGVLSDAA